MNPASGAASATPGVSLNFDVQALHDAEELEYQREEAERQNELKQLLTTAFDDLSDEDEDSQLTSANQSQISNDDPEENHVQNGDLTWQPEPPNLLQHGYQLAHTSTPIMGPAPPLATPAPHYPYNAAQPHYFHQKHPLHDAHLYHQVASSDVQQYHQGAPNPHHAQPSELTDTDGEERGETEGGNDAEHYFDPSAAANGAASHEDNFHPVAPPLPQQPPPHVPIDYKTHHDVAMYGEGHNYAHAHQGYYNDYFSHHGLPLQENDGVFPLPYSPNVPPVNTARHHTLNNPALETYKVKYMGSTAGGASVGAEASAPSVKPSVLSPGASQPPPVGSHQNEAVDDTARPLSPSREYDNLQKEYLNQGGSPESRRLTQLNILYNARGRKIDELDRELKKTKEESDREIRILKHKVALTEDERQGMGNSLDNAQQLVRDGKQRESELQGRITGLEMQLQTLQSAKEQYISKLQAAESTIETLTEQLSQLGSSDTLTRTRDQHAAVVAGMQSKYEAQLLMLKEKIDTANIEKDEKIGEIEKLKRQVIELTKSSEQMRIERADAINRLNRSLEESQRQCQQLIEAGTGQELSRMKIQLQEVIAGKSISEDMNSALQEEIRELREQVTMYESASQFGVFPGASSILPSAIHPDDSYSQLGIRPKPKPSISGQTPDRSDPGSGNLTTEETLHGLKSELERCLVMYKNKRQQVTSLSEELRNNKSARGEAETKLQLAEKMAKDAQERLMEETSAGDTSVREVRLQKEVKALSNERETLLLEIEELTKRIEEIAASEEQLKQANRELSAQMAEMVREFDEDKKEALDRCGETYRNHMDTTKAKLTEEMEADFSEQCSSLTSKYETQIKQLKEELDSVQQQLDEVKQMYVSVCETKDRLEHSADATLQSRLQQELDKLTVELRKEKDEELEQLKLSLTSNMDAAVANARDKWMKEQKSAKEREIEEQVAATKVQWMEEEKEKNDALIEDAVCTAERHWQHKWDTEMDHELESKLKEARIQWTQENRAILERELNKGLMAAKASWEQTELARAVEIEREKITKTLTSQKSADQASLEMEQKATVDKLKQEAAVELEKVSECFQQEITDLEKEKNDLEKKLSECEEKWLAERDALIKEKDGERRRAIKEVQDQNETDYHNFLKEHHDTLDKALKAARQQFAQEMEDVTKKHSEDISKLKEKEAKLSKVQEEQEKEQASVEAAWNEKLESLTQQHQEEKDALMVSHRENLFKALEEARGRWQKKFEEAVAETSDKGMNTSLGELRLRHLSDEAKRSRQQLEEFQQRWEKEEKGYIQKLEEQEKRWEEERQGFIEQVQERDALLQSADEHLEGEVNRLQQELLGHHQQQMNDLRNSHNSELASTRAELDAQLAALRIQIEASNQDEVEQELKAAKSQLKELEIQYTEEVNSLKKVIDSREKELRKMRKELEEIKSVVDEYDNQKQEATQQAHDLQQQLEKAESQRHEALEALQSSMAEHNQVINTYKDKQKDLTHKLQRTERKFRSLESSAQKQLTSMQESMEREHSVAMEKLKGKMMELRSNHLVAMDSLQQKHEAEKSELEKMMMAAVKRHEENGLGDSSSQATDEVAAAPTAITEMRSYYLNIIAKMRADVLHHVSNSNERAAITVREEVIRDRQKTAKRLRKYYMKCLSRLLDMDGGGTQGMKKDEKLAFMENALDNLPDRDSSSSGTGHSGPSTGSDTPDVLTPRAPTTVASQPSTNSYSNTHQMTSHTSGHPSHPTAELPSGGYQNMNEQSHYNSHDSSFTSSHSRLSHYSPQTQHSQHHHKPNATGEFVTSPDRNTSGRLRDKSYLTDPSGSETDSELLHTGSSTASGSIWRTLPNSSSRNKQRNPSTSSKKTGHGSDADHTDHRSALYESDQSGADGRTHVARRTAGDYIRSYQSSLKNASKQRSGSIPSNTFDEVELRKYYDIDMGALSKSDERRKDAGKRGQASLTKVNADTFVLTPTKQLGMHNSQSVGDIRQCGDESMTRLQVHHGTLSDDALNTDNEPTPRNIGSYRYKPLRNMSIAPFTGNGPSKSQSMPDVALAQEAWLRDSKGHLKGSHRMPTSASLEHDQSIDSITYEPSSQGSVKSQPTYTGFHSRDEYAPLRLKSRNKEGYHVSFNVTNIDLNDSGSLSDNESVRSIVSTSSVSSFRQALKSKQSSSSSSAASSKQPMKVAHSSVDPDATYVKSPSSVHKPIAMVTRHTQIPSPFLSKRK